MFCHHCYLGKEELVGLIEKNHSYDREEYYMVLDGTPPSSPDVIQFN